MQALQAGIPLKIKLGHDKRRVPPQTLPLLILGIVVAGDPLFAFGKEVVINEVVPAAVHHTSNCSGQVQANTNVLGDLSGKSGQALGKTPARVKAEAEPLLNSPHAPAEGQAVAGTMAQKLTGRFSHPSTNWLAWTYTFLATVGTPYRAV